MKELACRLNKGDDLRQCIEKLCEESNTCVVLSGVGSLTNLKIRLAKAIDYYEKQEDYEIVSLTGTISNGSSHIHISVSDDKGNIIGGHLEYGCLINTTCELVIGELEEYDSIRTYDDKTGYDEIVFKKKVED